MNTRFLATAAAALTMLSTSAFAASMTSGEKCVALEKQFDSAITQHASAPKATSAKQLRMQATKLCTTKPASGVKKLDAALKDLGVKPQV